MFKAILSKNKISPKISPEYYKIGRFMIDKLQKNVYNVNIVIISKERQVVMGKIKEIFGCKVFSDAVMREKLPKDTYKALKQTISEGSELDINMANVVAHAMKEWALENGCTHYTHWFQPLTGVTAEKHDSFISIQPDGSVLEQFSGKMLIKGEPDASSFPSGGIRSTFEARGYTAWDPTSYAFIKDNTLCIPTAFCSYNGEVLDTKTPLLRSIDALSNECVRLLKILGRSDVTRVMPTVGPEQEYFIIPQELFKKRRDLMYTGRTLFGAKPPKGQELDDQYFASIRPEVKSFMADLNTELWSIGIYANTEHNEVAPAQHELAPIFTNVNLATDHNQLVMEMMKKVALRHGLVCILHEKPFKGVNGSGKHNNWSLSANTGENLLKPGKDPYNNTQFLLFIAAAMKAVDEYQDLLRISVSSAGNDHRLGANEAPPAIVSMFLGDDLTDVLDAIVSGRKYAGPAKITLNTGVDVIPEFIKDTTDRNRTSPFAFTGNKFEFRMLGSAQSIADPNIVINTIMAEAISEFADKLEKKSDVEAAARKLIKETVKKHSRIVFNGNGYTDEWVAEAEARGLSNYRTTADAVPHMVDAKNVKMFVRHRVYTEKEIYSRCEIMLEEYVNMIRIEVITMLDMSKKQIIPACLEYEKELAGLAAARKSAGSTVKGAEMVIADKISVLTGEMYDRVIALEELLHALNGMGSRSAQEQSVFIRDNVIPAMNEVRSRADALEITVSKKYWPFPTYGDLLYY